MYGGQTGMASGGVDYKCPQPAAIFVDYFSLFVLDKKGIIGKTLTLEE